MSDETRTERSTSGVPRTPGTSPIWYAAAAASVVAAFAVGVWFDGRTPSTAPPAEIAGGLPADHPPVDGAGGAPPAVSGMGDYDPAVAEEVWSGSCAICHGTDGEPTRAAESLGTPDLRDPAVLAGKSEADIERVIREGAERMPSYGDTLPPETIHALVHKVQSLASR